MQDNEHHSYSAPTEEHLDTFRKFISTQNQELRSLESALEDSSTDVWDPYQDVVGIELRAHEDCHISTLIETDSKDISKVLIVFSTVAEECARLVDVAEQRFFGPLSCYGERFDNSPLPEGAEVEQISSFIPLLEDLSHFAARCHSVVANALSQLAGLYTDEKNTLYKSCFKGTRLHSFLTQLGELLRVLITLDGLVGSNQELQYHWSEYKRVLQSAALEPEVFGMRPKRIAKVLMAVMRLEADVFNGAMLRGCWMQDLPWYHEKGEGEIRANKTMLEEVTSTIRSLLVYLSAHIGDATESNHRKWFVGVVGLFALFAQVNRGRELDSKTYKSIVSLSSKVPLIVLFGRAFFVVTDFLHDALPLPATKTREKELEKTRALFLKQEEALLQQLQRLQLEVSAWMVRMESSFSPRVGLTEVLSTRANLLVQGVLLASQLGNVGKLSLSGHLWTRTAIRQSSLKPLMQSFLLLKALQQTYHRKSFLIASHLVHIQRFLQLRVLHILDPICKDLETQIATARKGGWKVEEPKVHMAALVTAMCDNLRGPNTRQRRTVVNLAWDLLPKKQIREGDVDEVGLQLRKLEILGSLQEMVGEATDCSFLLWSRGLLPLFLADLRSNWKDVNQIHGLMAAMGDAGRLLKEAEEEGHIPSSSVSSFSRFLKETVEWEIVTPLSQEIETDLRIHIHSAQISQMVKSNPLKSGTLDLFACLQLQPVFVVDEFVNIKERVASYLDSTFYDLTTVTTHDWKTYAEMKNLAQDKYRLSLIETYLPTGTLDQGLDVLEIMRHIHVFVANYTYHLHTQVFIEKPGENKYIRSIGIQQVANSIRTHGMGIMNTTVNYTYQFLARKLAIMSQFLFDDHIKSRLVKDVNFFRQNKM
ncbi:hypothetical protein GUITHDRAFT_139069, partial [Guillardia theta CCMP2712]